MKKRRKFDGIRFFREKAKFPPQYTGDVGYILINDQWMTDEVEINGIRPDCPAVDLNEFHKMLQAPGDYWPFTCTCGHPEDADINFPVRCYHKDDLIVMVIREPLRWNPPCDFCDKKKSAECPDEYEWGRCPDPQFHYHAFRFRKDDIRNGLAALSKALFAQDPI